jgi:hypothetical protein
MNSHFSEETRELKRNMVLGEKYAAASGREKRFEINRAFRAYLEIGLENTLVMPGA